MIQIHNKFIFIRKRRNGENGNLTTGDVIDELWLLGEANWRPPPSSKTALSSSFTVLLSNSTKFISESLPLKISY